MQFEVQICMNSNFLVGSINKKDLLSNIYRGMQPFHVHNDYQHDHGMAWIEVDTIN